MRPRQALTVNRKSHRPIIDYIRYGPSYTHMLSRAYLCVS